MATNNGTLTMKLQQVKDLQSGLPAYTYLAPEGWDIKDQVVWDRNNMYNPAHLYAHCYDNNGITIQLQAGYTNRYWATPFGNSGNYPPQDITAALKYYMQWLRGVNVRFTEATVLSSSQEPGMSGFNFNTTITRQYGRVRGEYELNGIKFDEILYGTMMMLYMGQPPDYMGFFYEDVSWEIDNLFLSCASANRNPEEGVATAFAIKTSARQTSEFINYEQQTIDQLRKQYNAYKSAVSQPVKDSGKTSADITRETNDYINKLYEDTRKKQQISRDNNHEQFVDYIRDVDRYTDGKGTEYMLPTGYGSSYVSSLGTVLMVDKNSPDPNLYDTSYESWTKLGLKKY